MADNWVNNLDMCAQNGILNYDGAAFIKGQTPRYVGSPQGQIPPITDIPEKPLMAQPEVDEFKRETTENKKDAIPINIPTWKKWAFGGLALGCIILAGFKCKSVYNWIKNKLHRTPNP